MQRTRAANRCHPKSLLGGDDLRITREDFVQLGSRIHLLPHVQIVVRGCAVRAESQIEVGLKHLRNRSDARSEFHVRLRIVNNADAETFQDGQLFGSRMNDVRGDDAIIQEADAREIINRRDALALRNIVNLFARLRNVNHNGRARSLGKIAHLLEMIFGDRVRRVRRDSGRDERIAFPLLDEPFCVSHRIRPSLIVSDGKVYDRLAEHAAHASLHRLVRDGILEVVHIAVGGRAAANHFGESEPCADAHELFGNILRFSREDVFRQPLLQIKIVCQPAKERHRHVRVAVDETGNDDLAARINRLARGVFSLYLGALADGNDATITHDDCAVFDNAPLVIHRDDSSARYDEIGARPTLRGSYRC